MKGLTATIAACMAGFCIAAGIAFAQIVPSLPVNLQNNTLADATQVMANFNAIVTGVNANGAKNGVNTDITSLAGLITPLSPAQGGSSYYTGGNSAGTANAQTISVLPAGFALANGIKVSFIAGSGNTSAMTLNVQGLGAKNVFRVLPGGPAALGGGEIVASQLVQVVYDGTQFQLLNSARPELPGTTVVNRSPTVPVGFLAEDGSSQLRATWPALFAAIGTTYGSADGTHFNLPDSRGRLDAGQDNQGGVAANRITNAGSGCDGTVLGGGCGTQNLTIGQTNLPAVAPTFTGAAMATHTHTVPLSTQNETISVGGTGVTLPGGTTTSSAVSAGTPSGTISNLGSGTALASLNPLLIATKMIRY